MSPPSVRITRTCPTGSSRRAPAARLFGTNRRVNTMAARPIGTLTQKIERQPRCSVSTPPTTGPMANEMPNTEPQRPIAFARSAGSVNTERMIDMATGLSIDPPTACSTLAAMSQPTPGARLHRMDPPVNTTRPAPKIGLRPTRSATDPLSRSRLARVSR